MANSTEIMLKEMHTTGFLTKENPLVEQGHDAVDQQNENGNDYPKLTPTPGNAPAMVDILMDCLNPGKKPKNRI